MRRFYASIELEWKIIAVAAALFVAFLWPIQRLYMHRMRALLELSVDPRLDSLLRSNLSNTDPVKDKDLLCSIERHRQWRAMLPVILDEQRRSITWFSAGLFAALSCLALYILSRLTKPLKKLSLAAERIGKGNVADIRVTSGGSLGKLQASMAKMQEELRAFREHAQAEGMEMAWRDIARVMAHEIKNPLTPIRLTLDLMDEKAQAGAAIDHRDLKKYLDRIVLQVEHLEALVDSFRSFAREPEVMPRRVELRRLVEDVAGSMKPSLATTIEGEAAADADPRLVNQVLLNIWKNAAEAGATRVRVAIEPGGEFALVRIADDGPGIARERLERVWIPYVTYKKGGTGLGLPVVKRLVEAMGGSAALSSSCDGPDRGVTVTLRFRRPGPLGESAGDKRATA